MSATAYGESDPRLKKRQRNTESARLTWLESPRSRRCRNEMCSQTPEPARHRSEKLHDSTLSYERLAAAAFQSEVRLARRAGPSTLHGKISYWLRAFINKTSVNQLVGCLRSMPTHHLRLFSGKEGRTGKELLYFFFDPRGQVCSPLQFAHAIVPDWHKDEARILHRALFFSSWTSSTTPSAWQGRTTPG
jgi:hypothetical protein